MEVICSAAFCPTTTSHSAEHNSIRGRAWGRHKSLLHYYLVRGRTRKCFPNEYSPAVGGYGAKEDPASNGDRYYKVGARKETFVRASSSSTHTLFALYPYYIGFNRVTFPCLFRTPPFREKARLIMSPRSIAERLPVTHTVR